MSSALDAQPTKKRKISVSQEVQLIEQHHQPRSRPRPDQYFSQNSEPSMRPAKKLSIKSNAKKAPAKKITIKGFKVAPSLPASYEGDTWLELQDAVRAVHSSRPVRASLQELYKKVENLCEYKQGASLYDKLVEEMRQHVSAAGERLAGGTEDGERFLGELLRAWDDHCRHTKLIRSVFLHLDRTYVIQTPNVRSIWDVGLRLFREYVALLPSVRERAVRGLLALVDAERTSSGGVESQQLVHAVRMSQALQCYDELVDAPYTADSKRFYEQEAREALRELAGNDTAAAAGGGSSAAANNGGSGETASAASGNTVARYVQLVERRLREELSRAQRCLDTDTSVKVAQIIEQSMVEARCDLLLANGLAPLADEGRCDDLARMYTLLERVALLDKLRAAWKAHVLARGQRVVRAGVLALDECVGAAAKKGAGAGAAAASASAAAPPAGGGTELIDELVAFAKACEKVYAQAFDGNFDFVYATKDAFEVFVNEHAARVAQLLAKYADALLRTGKARVEADVDGDLDNVIVLFRYLHSKDVFEAFFKKDLAKRLLLQKSASKDAERSMLAKLKGECGAQFTSKLEGMFKDVALSQEVVDTYRQQCAPEHREPELTVAVLTQGFWPSYPLAELTLPAAMAAQLDAFKAFYQGAHQNRTLTYVHALGQCVLRARFGASTRKELALSLHQAAVLLLLNERKTVTLRDVSELTSLDVPECRRTLRSLCNPKAKVLLAKRGDTADDLSMMFAVNENFKHKMTRVKINQLQMRETVEEVAKVKEGVEADRQYQIDAAVVRIMKARKRLEHGQLITEIMQQLKFPVAAGALKKRIESLIEREYLERDEDDSRVYKYLA